VIFDGEELTAFAKRENEKKLLEPLVYLMAIA